MFNIEKFKEELSKYGLTLETYDKIITDIDSKIDGENDYDWSEIKDKYGINCNSDTIRKSSSTPFGGNIRGNNIFAAHGHKDSPSNVVQNFTMMFNIKPDIVLLGHRHTNGLTTVYDTKVIESGCVSGSDQFALSIRKVNRPEQTVSVIGDNGLICLYDIQLN